MKIRVLEWIGLIMADMLSFLVVGLAFLYTFTEPLHQTKLQELARQTVRQQSAQIARLEHTVKGLQHKLAGAQKKQPTKAQSAQAHVRLFPGDVLVYAGSRGQARRLDRDRLLQELQPQKTPLEIVLSAEPGVGYDRLTKLAADLMRTQGVSVRFGW